MRSRKGESRPELFFRSPDLPKAPRTRTPHRPLRGRRTAAPTPQAGTAAHRAKAQPPHFLGEGLRRYAGEPVAPPARPAPSGAAGLVPLPGGACEPSPRACAPRSWGCPPALGGHLPSLVDTAPDQRPPPTDEGSTAALPVAPPPVGGPPAPRQAFSCRLLAHLPPKPAAPAAQPPVRQSAPRGTPPGTGKMPIIVHFTIFGGLSVLTTNPFSPHCSLHFFTALSF
ncbi:vegetative cell wall protein gp1-like [Jatropha curcas]|uniref:vegetative cell wall protein gp1-like n=1 Tax=Jatropha curcas TaxID=180498 RepID=UPI001893B822|nr:vegetative cell wall protein gp1-like [Jatropha curcas]